MPGNLAHLPGLDLLRSYLLAIKESLAAIEITPDLLIVEDLGLDSMDLTELAARIRADLGDIDFMPWLAHACVGEGTVASLAEFVAAACPGALAERKAQP